MKKEKQMRKLSKKARESEERGEAGGSREPCRAEEAVLPDRDATSAGKHGNAMPTSASTSDQKASVEESE